MLDRDDKTDRLIEQIAAKQPNLVEFRLDKLSDSRTLEAIAKKKTFPAIATDKRHRDPKEAQKLLLTAAQSGFEYVDIDLDSNLVKDLMPELKSLGAQVIISWHDFTGTPSQSRLIDILNLERQVGADLCKVVTTAHHHSDNLRILEFLQAKSSEFSMVCFAMGLLGRPSRILSPLFGSEFTFAALSEDTNTADGQLSIDNLRNAWQLLGIQ
jgi:3-dehydroquinate dehydratase type I